MAPHASRDCYGPGESGRYSLRTSKHCETNRPRGRDADASRIHGKEDFFRCIGLEMRKRSLHRECETPNSDPAVMNTNIHRGVGLRDCRVVILGSNCGLCGTCFKCETDLAVHRSIRHKSHHKLRDDRDSGRENELYDIILNRLDTSCGSNVSQLHKKLRITLRIGAEVVAKLSVKKKHLNMSESSNESGSVAGDACENPVSPIDHPAFPDGPDRCSERTIAAVDSDNRYLADVPENDRLLTETGGQVPNSSRESSGESCEERRCSTRDSLERRMPEIHADEDQSSALRISGFHFVSAFDASRAQSLREGTNDSPRATVRSDPRASFAMNRTSEDGAPTGITRDEGGKEQVSQSGSLGPATPTAAVDEDNSAGGPEVEAGRRDQVQREDGSSPSGGTVDNDVQEILRIVRGDGISTEINHESPNRLEQKMLIDDAIRDMRRMEDLGWHLLEKQNSHPKKRKRTPKCKLSNEKSPNKRSGIQPNFGNNVVKSSATEKDLEKAPKVPRYEKFCPTDSLKENLVIRNGNIPAVVLHKYGIHFDDEGFEINNNAPAPVGYFPGPCSPGMVNARPIVIDLVNDVDE